MAGALPPRMPNQRAPLVEFRRPNRRRLDANAPTPIIVEGPAKPSEPTRPPHVSQTVLDEERAEGEGMGVTKPVPAKKR